MKTKIKKIVILLCVALISLTLVACENKASDLKTEPNTENNTKEIETANSELVDNIINNINEWEFVSDSFTREYTYDKVEIVNLSLYSTGNKGEYYFAPMYSMPSDGVHGITIYHKVFLITNTKFEYLYGNEYNTNDEIVKNYRLLYLQSAMSFGEDRKINIEKMVTEGLKAEEKYFEEITLESTENIVLSQEGNKLFENLYSAILELEEYDPRHSGNNIMVPLAVIKYYDLGNGSCEMLLYHGFTGENIVSSFYVGGYLVDENGYSRLSYSDESKLKNTTNIETLKWNNDWNTDKKEYTLKKSIAKKYAIE